MDQQQKETLRTNILLGLKHDMNKELLEALNHHLPSCHDCKTTNNKLGCARVKLHFWLTILEMVTIPLLVVVRPGDGV